MSINELAKVAAVGKPKKERACEIVKELAEQHPESINELGALYAYFMPPKPRKPKGVWDWVALATPKKDARHYLNYVHVTADWITSTDGHRAHRAPNLQNLEPGYYNVRGDKLEEPDFAAYPGIDRVTPSLMGRTPIPATPGEWQVTEVKGTVCYVLPGGVHVNKRYMDDILAHPIGAEQVYVGENNQAIRVMFKNTEDTTAVLMPVRA